MQKGATGAKGVTGATGGGNSSSYAYAYYDDVQIGIKPGSEIPLMVLNSNQSGNYSLYGGGLIVPDSGVFLITFRVLTPDSASVEVSLNGSTIPQSNFGNNITGGVISGSLIANLTAGDLVTLTNGGTTIFSTIKSTHATENIVVSLILTKIN